MEPAFAVFHAKAENGPFAVLKFYREILDHNGVDDLPMSDKRSLMAYIEKNLMAFNDKTPEFYKALIADNEMSLQSLNAAVKLKPEPAVRSKSGKILPKQEEPEKNNDRPKLKK